MKRFFSILLAICLVVGMLPTLVFAAAPTDPNADDAGNLIFEIDGIYYLINLYHLDWRDEDEEWWGSATVIAPPEGEAPYTGEVHIPSDVEYTAEFGDGYYWVSAIGDSAFRNSQITNISFGDFSAFGYIGAYAFAGCSNLSGSLTVASVTRIGSYAFQDTNFDLTVMVNSPGMYTENSFEGVRNCKMKYITPTDVHAYSGGKVDFDGVGTPDARYKLKLLCDGDEVVTVYVDANTDAGHKSQYTFAPEHFSRAGRYTVSVQTVEPENYDAWAIADSAAAEVEFPVKVTFDANGRGTAPESQEVVYGGKPTLPAEPTDPEGTLVFAGWYKEASCENKWDFDKDTVKENITLYAKWTAPLSLTLDTDGLTRASAAFSWTPARISQDPDHAGRINGLVYEDSITLTVSPNPNCKFNSVPELALTNAGRSIPTEQDGSYIWTITRFTGDATVSIRGTAMMQGITPDVPDIPIVKVWDVTLPTGAGYTAKAAEGSVSTVTDGNDYSFTVSVAEGYNGDDMVVKANGTVLTAENGIYTIENITEDQTVTVEGITAPPGPATYTVTYNANGGTGTVPVDNKLYASGDKVIYAEPTGLTGPDGKVFVYWDTDPNGDTNIWYPGEEIITQNMYLYAIWRDPQISVTYSANGESVNVPIDSKKYDKEEDITVKAPVETLTSDNGKIFIGWNTKADGSGDTYQAGDTFKLYWLEDVTLYAMWAEAVTVTYNANGGTGTPPETAILAKGSSYVFTYPDDLTPPDGKAFYLWGESPEGGNNFHDTVNEGTVNEDMTLYAIWRNTQITVTYSANGERVSVPTDSTKYDENEAITVKTPVTTLTAGNEKIFTGWNTKADGSGTTYQAGDTFSLSWAEDVTLYAQWSEAVTVTYNANGAEGTPPEPDIVAKGGKIVFASPDTLIPPSGKVFKWWGSAPNGGNNLYGIVNENTVYDDMVLYAVWEDAPTPASHTVTVQTEGSGTASASPTTAAQGTKITLAATPADGWFFKEWVVVSGGMTVSSNEFTMPDGNVEIKAVFEETPPPSSGLQIYIAPGSGETIILDLEPADSIENVKQQIQDKTGIAPAKQILVFDGKTLEDGRTLADYNIQTGDTLYLSLTANSFTISVSASPAAGGSVTGGGTYNENAAVTLTATANTGYHFVKWTENGVEVTGAGATYAFTATADRSLVAVFEANEQPPQPTTYQIVATVGANGNITPTSANVAQGGNVSFTVAPSSGYELDALTLDGTDVTAQVINGEYTLSNVQQAHTVHATFKLREITPPYVITEGANLEVTQGNLAVFISDAPFAKFREVRVDGNVVAPANYIAESGSTKVTLKAEYSSTLSVGEHTLIIVSEGGEASTKFTVKAAAAPSDPDIGDHDDPDADADISQTGDNSNMGLWLGSLMLSAAGLAGSTVLFCKRRRTR